MPIVVLVGRGEVWVPEFADVDVEPRRWKLIDSEVPDAPWFWKSLTWYCVPECCGIDAYEFSEDSVRWALGLEADVSGADCLWRDDHPGDARELATALSASANRIRSMDVDGVWATQFNHYLTPASHASLFEYLSDVLRRVAEE